MATCNGFDDEAIVSMCMALNAEDPGPNRVQKLVMRGVRSQSCEETHRAWPCYVTSSCAIGYALLISFWSNELGVVSRK